MRLKVVGKNPRQIERVQSLLSFIGQGTGDNRLKYLGKTQAFGLMVLSYSDGLLVLDCSRVNTGALTAFVRQYQANGRNFALTLRNAAGIQP